MLIEHQTLEFGRGPKVALKPNFPHRRFEEHARKTPDAIAIFHEEGQLTYAQLNARANHLAKTLKAFDVGPETIVALFTERSIGLVIGTLATHKAGGACAFIEPSTPFKRLEMMLAEISPALILTSKKYRSKLENIPSSIIVLDEIEYDKDNQDISFPATEINPENLSYIFFTSGSSGTPKAVMSPYGYYTDQDTVDVGTERHLLKTDSGTTFTRTEMLRPLMSGQQLFIAPSGLEKNFQELALYISKHKITHLISTPTALRVLLDSDNISLCQSLRSVTCSGEYISPQLKKDFLTRLDAEMHIIYGCTEVPGAVSMKINRDTNIEFEVTGRPAPMMEAYVLDDEMQPVPLGSEGEIYLGGMMARGYFNAPDLTAQKFVAHPFSSIPGQRLFKSGDRGRWQQDGYLQVLGRSDSQVKIRGYRIELGEIEAALQELPQVRQAAVIMREDIPDHKFLAAYIVSHDPNIGLDEIRMTLKQHLPEYMIPSSFTLLAELPLTASGKVDRMSLPRPQQDKISAAGRLNPDDPYERHLLAIWKNLLKVSSIGMYDNFFDLGGNSLLAAQMVDQIQKVFQKKLPLDFLWFHGGTIAAIASALRDQYRFGSNAELVLIKKGSRQPLFVLHTRGGYLLDYYELARHLAPDQAVYGLQARGVFGNELPDCDTKEIAARCIKNMRKIQPHGPYLITGYSSGGVIAYEMAQQLSQSGEKVALLAMLDTNCPWVYQAHRWHDALKRLLRGRVHRFRHLLHSALLTSFGLNRLLKIKDVHIAHKYALMAYQPYQTTQAIDIFIADESIKHPNHELLGWKKWFKGPVKTHHFAANHSGLVKLPVVDYVAKTLQTCIDSVTSD